MNLEIYCTIENHHISEKISKEIEDACRLYVQQQGYILVKFKKYSSHRFYSNISKDAIKKGICVLNEMAVYLKFRSTNNIWLLYISTGNTFDSNGNPFNSNIFLLNRNINAKSCFYLIKEYFYNIYFKDYLMQLFESKHYLNYSNVFDLDNQLIKNEN